MPGCAAVTLQATCGVVWQKEPGMLGWSAGIWNAVAVYATLVAVVMPVPFWPIEFRCGAVKEVP